MQAARGCGACCRRRRAVSGIVPAGFLAAIGVEVAINGHPSAFLALAVVLNPAYWVLGQGPGGAESSPDLPPIPCSTPVHRLRGRVVFAASGRRAERVDPRVQPAPEAPLKVSDGPAVCVGVN